MSATLPGGPSLAELADMAKLMKQYLDASADFSSDDPDYFFTNGAVGYLDKAGVPCAVIDGEKGESASAFASRASEALKAAGAQAYLVTGPIYLADHSLGEALMHAVASGDVRIRKLPPGKCIERLMLHAEDSAGSRLSAWMPIERHATGVSLGEPEAIPYNVVGEAFRGLLS